jgi:hypothetical protein
MNNRPKCKTNVKKLSEENMENKYDHVLGKHCLDNTPKSWSILFKKKKDKLDFINIKIFSLKAIIMKMKILAMDWKKIFANNTSSEFIHKICPELSKLNKQINK